MIKKILKFSLPITVIIVLVVILINHNPIIELSDRASWLNTNQELRVDAARKVEKLIRDAEDDGMCLVVTSGYRTHEEQKEIYEEYGPQRAEKPGDSEHESGIAVDFGGCPMSNGERDDEAERKDLEKDFKELPEYQWLKENASKYGFSQSYKGNGDIINEPWHWRINK